VWQQHQAVVTAAPSGNGSSSDISNSSNVGTSSSTRLPSGRVRSSVAGASCNLGADAAVNVVLPWQGLVSAAATAAASTAAPVETRPLETHSNITH
jgi:hypothetical protein